MALIRAKQWAAEHFAEGSRPSARTIRKWIEAGEVQGVVLGGNVYVEEDSQLFTAKGINDAPPLPKGIKLL